MYKLQERSETKQKRDSRSIDEKLQVTENKGKEEIWTDWTKK